MQKKAVSFFRRLENNLPAFLFSLLAGVCAGALVYIYHFQLPLFSKSRIALCAVIGFAFSLLVFFSLQRFILPLFQQHNKKKQVLIILLTIIASLLLAFMLDYTILRIHPLYPQRSLLVEMDLSNLPEDIEGVSFSHLELAYRDVGYSEFTIDGDYEKRDAALFFPTGQIASIRWQGITGELARLAFEPTSQPFEIQVHWDEGSDDLDLYQSGDVLAIHTKDFPLFPHEALIIHLLSLPLIFAVLFGLLNGLFSPRPYAGFMLMIWLFIYLLYYPGIIGDVNIVAVDDLLAGQPTDWHPIIYTLLVAFNIRFLASASSLLVMQFSALALIFHNVFSYLQEKEVSRVILVALSLLIALLPTNFLSMITLTNDIPYSITLTALTFLIFKIIVSNGKWLESKTNLLLLSLTASLAILFRYNGIPAVAFFFVCLLLAYPKHWLRSLLSAAVVMALWFFVTGPLYNMLNVTSQTEGHFDNILLHHISAHVDNGTPLSVEESAYLDSLLPLEEWKYSCCTNASMWQNDDFDREAFHTQSAYNRRLALSLFRRNPALEIGHMLCASDIVWDTAGGCEIKHPSLEYIREDYFWTGSYFPQYQESSFFPMLVKPISAFISYLDGSPLFSSIFWRPAWYLYLSIICVIVFAMRNRSIRGLLLLAPIMGQSLFLLLFNRVQNFRYQYCVVLVGLLLLALVFYKPRED